MTFGVSVSTGAGISAMCHWLCHWYHVMLILFKSNFKKNKLLQDIEEQNIFQAQTSFHHDKQCGFITSVENVTHIQYSYLTQMTPLAVWWMTAGAKWCGTWLLMQDHLPTHYEVLTQTICPCTPCTLWWGCCPCAVTIRRCGRVYISWRSRVLNRTSSKM